MTAHPYHARLERVLARMGGLYTFNDIMSLVAQNQMQSWAEGDSWALTRIGIYPRGKAVEVMAVVGSLEESRILHDRIIQFANEVGAKVIQAYGRIGWKDDAEERGWKVVAENYVYQRVLQ